MIPYETPIEIELGGQPVAILGTDTGSYVAADGRTWLHPETPGEDIATVQAHIEAAIANPPEPELSIEQVWENWLAGYITDPATNIELKTSISACNRFAAMEALLSSGLEHGAITGESPVAVWDRSNVEHIMTVADCRALLLRYGTAWQAAFNELAP